MLKQAVHIAVPFRQRSGPLYKEYLPKVSVFVKNGDFFAAYTGFSAESLVYGVLICYNVFNKNKTGDSHEKEKMDDRSRCAS